MSVRSPQGATPRAFHCVFCGSYGGGRSKEHLFRRKFKDEFPWEREIAIMQPSSEGFTHTELRPISQFDITLNSVCRQCNQGWLNDLEAEIEPLLLVAARDGLDLHTTPKQMERLGFWAVTRALLRTQFTPTARAPLHLFRTAFRTRKPPPGCFAHWAYSEQYVAHAGVHESPHGLDDDDYFAQVSFGLKHMLFQVGISGGSEWSQKTAFELLLRPRRWFPQSFYWIVPTGSGPVTIQPLTPEAAYATVNTLSIAIGLPILTSDGSTLDPTDVIPARHHQDLVMEEFAGVPAKAFIRPSGD